MQEERLNLIEHRLLKIETAITDVREAMRECAGNSRLHPSVHFLADTLAINLRGVATTPVCKGLTLADESPRQYEADDVGELVQAAASLADVMFPNSTATVTQRLRAIVVIAHEGHLSPGARAVYDQTLAFIVKRDAAEANHG